MANGFFGVAHFLGGNVFGQFDVNRARTLFGSESKSFADDGRNARAVDDLLGKLRQRAHHADHVDDLELTLLALLDRLLPGDHHQRHAAQLSISSGCDEVRRAGAKRGKTDAGLAGETSISGGHKACRLFVPGENQLDLRCPQRFQEVEILFSWDAEDVFNALILESFDKEC